jgi:aspartyl/asparaginyl beta-hydroxylase (cupin superfamily)
MMTDYDSLGQTGVAALSKGDAATARQAFEAIANAGRASLQLWLLLAQSCDMLDDRVAAHRAADQVLADDHRNLYALLMKADLHRRDGEDRAAAGWYARAFSIAQGLQGLPDDLIERLRKAERDNEEISARFHKHLHNMLAAAHVDLANIAPRFLESLAILSGTQQVYVQQPSSFYYPGLPQTTFYDATDFTWADALENQWQEIAAEAVTALSAGNDISPYVEADSTRPNRGHALLNDDRWSAFHIWKAGKLHGDAAQACPRTVAALQSLPLPQIQSRSPMALFSILKPHTHIPPHNGMLNTRLICHLPLIVPPSCKLRVGNQTRPVVPGKLMIFDDSIEHEAWNDSDAVRVVLLFEIWRPELSVAERMALTAMFESIQLYGADS